MSRIRLPKDLTEYFVLSKSPKTGDYHRFHLYFPYLDGRNLERLHREWKVTGSEEATDPGIAEAKLEREKTRFRKEIEHWLEESGKILTGDGMPELRDE